MEVQAWMLAPFAVMLLLIATAPLFAEKFWEKNLNKLIVTAAIALPTAIFLTCVGLGKELAEQLLFDYVPFIILLLSLFVITGGIQIKGDVVASPTVNTALLATGFILASFMGTTGAAMLLIRPLLETNRQRKYKTHTVLFFIALVANAGGVLSPLGDPPLFLLFLRGASFTWFFNLAPQWAFVGAMLLVIYAVTDNYLFRKEPVENRKRDLEEVSPIRIKGRINFIFLALIIASVIFLNPSYIPAIGEETSFILVRYIREIALLSIVALSLIFTKKTVRKGNRFSWGPITEVAILFIGIFTTMTPALLFLNSHAAALGLESPWQFFYCTGLLSSFLDNAPTAVAFHTVASGLPAVEGATLVAGIPEVLLKAIALGAVFFGAMTYIGNGPNFMVKAIAEEYGVKMPSFFGYMLKFSLIILLPVYVLAQLIFL